MGGKKYSVILMRDDDHVRRFRLSSVWFKVAVYCVVLLCIVAVVGGYLGYSYFMQTQRLKEERTDLLTSIHSKDVELERLRNMERMVEAQQEEAMEMAAKIAREAGVEPPQPIPEPSDEPKTSPDAINLVELTQGLDAGDVAINELQLQRRREDMLRLRFVVANERERGALSGLVTMDFITNEGGVIPLQAPRDEMEFTIQRFKNVDVTAPLPNGFDRDRLYGLRARVLDSSGELIYSKTHPMQDVLGDE